MPKPPPLLQFMWGSVKGCGGDCLSIHLGVGRAQQVRMNIRLGGGEARQETTYIQFRWGGVEAAASD